MNLKSEKSSRLLELLLVIFLGITSVFSAFSAWQSALNSSAMSKYYNEGIATVTDANTLYVEAGQVYSNDVALYQQFISFQYDVDYATDEIEAQKAQAKIEDFMNTFLSENLMNAIIWAGEQQEEIGQAYISPFDNEDYWNSVYAEAQTTYQQGREMLEQGHVYNTNGDKMGLIVIYYAMVLFLLGIGSTLKRNELKVALGLFSIAIFVFATIQMAMIPFLSV
jgi:hypothetical protein